MGALVMSIAATAIIAGAALLWHHRERSVRVARIWGRKCLLWIQYLGKGGAYRTVDEE